MQRRNLYKHQDSNLLARVTYCRKPIESQVEKSYHKRTLAIGGGNRQFVSEEFWTYRTIQTESGETKVKYQHLKLDLRIGNKDNKRSEWQDAEPSQYEPSKK